MTEASVIESIIIEVILSCVHYFNLFMLFGTIPMYCEPIGCNYNGISNQTTNQFLANVVKMHNIQL